MASLSYLGDIASSALSYFNGGAVEETIDPEWKEAMEDMGKMQTYLNRIPNELLNENAKIFKAGLDEMLLGKTQQDRIVALEDEMAETGLTMQSKLGEFLVDDTEALVEFLGSSRRMTRKDAVLGLAHKLGIDKRCCRVDETLLELDEDLFEEIHGDFQKDNYRALYTSRREAPYLKAIPAEMRSAYANEVIRGIDEMARKGPNEVLRYKSQKGVPLEKLMQSEKKYLQWYVWENRGKSKHLQEAASRIKEASREELLAAIARSAGIEEECCDLI